MPPYPRPKSEAQRRLMRAVADNPRLAAEKGISQKVAGEFAKGDKPGKLPYHVKSKGNRRS